MNANYKNFKISMSLKSSNNKHTDKKNSKNAFFIEGGGTRGIYGIGVIKYLFGPNEYINLNDVEIFGGTSVGSYLAVGLCLGLNQNDMMEIAKSIDISTLVDNKYFYMSALYRFISKGYLYDDAGRQSIVKNILNFKFATIKKHLEMDIPIENFTFAHLKQLVEKYPEIYKHLIINIVDMSRKEQIFMTTLNDDCADITIFDAMLASSAIPFVFKSTILYHTPNTNKYSCEQISGTTTNYLVDGGLSTNNPLDYFLLNEEKYDLYNLWLLKFTSEPKYTQIDGNINLLKQVVDYLIVGKNDVKMNLIKNEYKINCINLHSTSGTLDIYPQNKVQAIINEIYNECLCGTLYFGN